MNDIELKLDSEEKDYLEGAENGQWLSTENLDQVEDKFKKAISIYRNNKQKITISLPTNDLYKIKHLGTKNGLTAEQLINALIHNYVSGKISIQL
jgi:predicted DNA binding CopG/RHH family protein